MAGPAEVPWIPIGPAAAEAYPLVGAGQRSERGSGSGGDAASITKTSAKTTSCVPASVPRYIREIGGVLRVYCWGPNSGENELRNNACRGN